MSDSYDDEHRDREGVREFQEGLDRQMELIELEQELKRQMGALPEHLTNEQVRQALLRCEPQMIIKHVRYFAKRGPAQEEYAMGAGAIPQPEPMMSFESVGERPSKMWGWDPAPDSCIPRPLVPEALHKTFDTNHYRYHTSDGDWYTLVPPNKLFNVEDGDPEPVDMYLLNDESLSEELKAARDQRVLAARGGDEVDTEPVAPPAVEDSDPEA